VSELVQTKPGTFVDTDEIAPEDVKSVATQDDNDFPTLSTFKFYPYVTFTSLERANYGIIATRGKAGAKEVESVQIGSIGEIEDLASLLTMDTALRLIETGTEYRFEEDPFVEVTTKEDYTELAEAAGVPSIRLTPRVTRKDWSPRPGKELRATVSNWEGSGVYDFREMPPTRHAASVEEYQRQGMEFESEQIIEMMFQGYGWQNDLSRVIDLLKDYDQ